MINIFRNFTKKKLAGLLLIIVIIIAFGFGGFGGGFNTGNQNNIAKINNTNIVLKKATSKGWWSSVAKRIRQCIEVAKIPDKTINKTANIEGVNILERLFFLLVI